MCYTVAGLSCRPRIDWVDVQTIVRTRGSLLIMSIFDYKSVSPNCKLATHLVKNWLLENFDLFQFFCGCIIEITLIIRFSLWNREKWISLMSNNKGFILGISRNCVFELIKRFNLEIGGRISVRLVWVGADHCPTGTKCSRLFDLIGKFILNKFLTGVSKFRASD